MCLLAKASRVIVLVCDVSLVAYSPMNITGKHVVYHWEIRLSQSMRRKIVFEVLFGEQFSFYFILWVCAVGVSHCNTIQLKDPSACELMFPLVWIGSSLSNHQASSIYCKLFWRSFRQHRSSVIRCEWGSCSAFSYFVYIYMSIYIYICLLYIYYIYI